MNQLRTSIFVVIVLIICTLTGCQPVVQQNSNNASTPQPSVSPTSTPAPTADVSRAAFTMPILAAMLRDDDFVKEVKTSISISDDELRRLREAVAEGMADLDENQETVRSTRSSSERAQAKVAEILGRERGDRLVALVQQRYDGKDTLADTQPNSVPSDTRVVVNIPAYRMDLFKDGKLVKTYKIGIGYPEFPLPIGLRQASEIIFNPEWTPPDEPWVKGKVKPFEKVEAGSKLNPLGPIKIPIGLPSLIHGGKSPARLGTFASHGCVGLTDAQVKDFAMELSTIAGKSILTEDIKKYLSDRTETRSVKLSHSIPVELRYETIVVENGTLKIFRDVYERGTNTQENLERVLTAYGTSMDQLDAGMREKLLAALKEMGLDASGHPADGIAAVNTNSKSAQKSSNSNSDRVTRNIKGRKEVDLPLPQLAGKGYPAPVNLRSA